MNNRLTKIFITHSSNDTAYVLILTELLRNIKVPNSCIICTSDPRYKIPNGENAYAWLRDQFIESDLHMIFVLSENYYKSNPCLNEMGAAWLVAKKSDLLLLPGFGFSDLKKKDGCLDKDVQGGSIDSDDRQLKAWLNNLRDDVVKEFEIDKPNDLDWEEYRDSFIKKMREVKDHKNGDNSEELPDEDKDSLQSDNKIVQAIIDVGGEIRSTNELAQITGLSMASVKRKLQEAVEKGEIEAIGAGKHKVYRIKKTIHAVTYRPTVGQDDVDQIPADSALLLVYAASDNGQIMKVQVLGAPVQVSAAGKQFMADNSQRESARWVEALDRLISWGWVKPMGYKGEIFELTGTGYQKADWLKEGMQINTDNEPLDELKEFGG